MNINDLDDYEVIEEAPSQMQASAQSKPLNLSDLGEDYEVVEEVKPSDTVQNNLQAKAGFIGGTVGTKALQSGVSNVAQKILNVSGELSPDQMLVISQNPDAYRNSRSFQDLLDQYKELTGQTRQKAFDFAKEAKESLKGLGPVKGDDLIGAISNLSSAPMVDIPDSQIPKPKVNVASTEALQKASNQKQILETRLQTMIDSGIESRELNKEIEQTREALNNINKDISRFSKQSVTDILNPIEPSLKEFSEITNIPEDILAIRPELQSKRLSPAYGNVLQKEVEFLKGGEIPAYDVGQKYIQQLQDAATYNPFGPVDETAKFKQEMARNVSEFLKSQSGAEEYTAKQALSKKAIELEQSLKEFGVGLDKEGNYKVTNPNKIQKIYKEGNTSEIGRLERLITEAQELGIDKTSGIGQSQLQTIDRFQSELPLSTIKKTVETAKDTPKIATAKRIVGATAGAALGGIPGSLAGLTAASVAPTGTKIQELASLAKGSKAFKAASKVAKFAGPLAGLAVAGMSFEDAQAQGLSAPESLATTAGEVLNPIPFTDVTGAYVQGKKEFEKTGEITPAVKKAGEAFIKPAVDIYNTPSNLPDSYDIRQMERGNIAPKKNAELMNDGKVTNVEGPELNALATQFEAMPEDKAAQEYSRVLRSIISSPSKNKEAQLAVLNQQPAFRELVRKSKGQK